MQNSQNSKVKQSKNAKALNFYIMICMLIQLLCSLTGAIISIIEAQNNLSSDKAWYLYKDDVSVDQSAIVSIL